MKKVDDGRCRPHTEATKKKISESRKGQATGHPFWGNREKIAETKRQNAANRVPTMLACARPECANTFVRKWKKQYCSISCARKVDGKLGQASKGRTPAEGSGRCKWYQFDSAVNNGIVKVQGTWELRVANCFEKQGLPWRTNHNRDRFAYIDINGVERTYCPDFWQDDTYVEVKGYADVNTQHKLAAVQLHGVPLKVLYWKDIKDLETELFGKPLAGVNTGQKLIGELAHGAH